MCRLLSVIRLNLVFFLPCEQALDKNGKKIYKQHVTKKKILKETKLKNMKVKNLKSEVIGVVWGSL